MFLLSCVSMLCVLLCVLCVCSIQLHSCHISINWVEFEITQAGWYEVREGSPVEVQWAVRWVWDDLWWKGFVERVSIKSGMEEKGSDGWCDGGDRWRTRLTEWGRKIIPKTGWCITERAICDFERGRWSGWAAVMRDDERVRPGGWTEIRLWR